MFAIVAVMLLCGYERDHPRLRWSSLTWLITPKIVAFSQKSIQPSVHSISFIFLLKLILGCIRLQMRRGISEVSVLSLDYIIEGDFQNCAGREGEGL